jgi:hypothetical protein
VLEIQGNRTAGAGNNFGQIIFYNNTSRNASITAFLDASGVNSGVLSFRTKEHSGSETERMRITSGGDVYFGNGTTNASPANPTIRATGGTGSNVAGGELNFYGGQSTGSAAGGPVRFFTSAAGSSGSSPNTNTERMRITAAGELLVGTATAQTGSRFVFDTTSTGHSMRLAGDTFAIFLLEDKGVADASKPFQYLQSDGGALIFGNADRSGTGSAGSTERMRITSGGALYLGNGQFSSSNPASVTFSTTEATGTDRVGTRLDIFGGRSTGSGNGGAITFTTSAAGSAGGGANTQTERVRVKQGGQVRFVPLAADPTLDVEDGDVYYNSATNKLRVRAGGAWVDLH